MPTNKTFILSDASVNSYGFSIDIENIDLARFEKNPVMFYNHWELIGYWENVRVEDGQLLAEPVFMEDDSETTALKIANRVDKGFLKAASLGINITKWTEEEGKAPLASVEVFECSIVDIPSNANAVTLYDKNGVELRGEAVSLALQAFQNQNTKKTENNTSMKLNAKSLSVLGVTETTPDEEVNNAVESLSAKNHSLSAENETLKAEAVKQKNEAVASLITRALSEGRFTADKKERYEKLAQQDLQLATDTINDLPMKKSLGGKEQLENKTELGDRESWTFEDWRKKDTAGLLAIKKENPDLYIQITNKN